MGKGKGKQEILREIMRKKGWESQTVGKWEAERQRKETKE